MKNDCGEARWSTWVASVQYLLLFLLVLCLATRTRADDAAPPPTCEQIEADWLRQDAVRQREAQVTPEEDAAGACDGVKNGKWGFHTALEDDPWWQIDLGDALPLRSHGDLQPLRSHGRPGRSVGRAAVRRRQGIPAGLPARRHGISRPTGRQAADGRARRQVRAVRATPGAGQQLPASGRGGDLRRRCERERGARTAGHAEQRVRVVHTQNHGTQWQLSDGARCPAGTAAGREPAATRGDERYSTVGGSDKASRMRTRSTHSSRSRRRSSNCRQMHPKPSGASCISAPAGRCANWRWPIRCWISTTCCWCAARPANGRTCRTSTRLVVAAGRRPVRAAGFQDGPAAAAVPDRGLPAGQRPAPRPLVRRPEGPVRLLPALSGPERGRTSWTSHVCRRIPSTTCSR